MSYDSPSIDLLPPWLSLFLVFFSDAIVNGIIVLISLSDSLLLVYKNAIDF